MLGVRKMKRISIFLTVLTFIAGMVSCGGVTRYDLTITSTSGGSVGEPGEGTFPYDEGTMVSLVATADSDCSFVSWTGDVETVADINAATTTIIMYGHYSITANFEQIFPGTFALCSPGDGATGVSLTPTIIWTDAAGAASYTVQIDDESTFSAPLVYENAEIAANTTSSVVPGGVLAPGTRYYWRVIAVNLTGSTIASNWPFSFTVVSSGALVPGFGEDGAVTSNPSPGCDGALAIVTDSAAMYIVGFDYSPGNYQWRIEKRNLADGSLVAEFGTGGVITSDPSLGDDCAQGVVRDSTAMYIVGFDYSPGNYQWRIEKRSLTDGTLVAEFGTGGVVTSNPSGDSDEALAIAIDSTAMYVVGYDGSLKSPPYLDYQWRIEKRSLTDGTLVAEFGTGGVVTSNPTLNPDSAVTIAIDSTAMYVAGVDWAGVPRWRIEKRSLADGSLVTGFGTGGVVTGNMDMEPTEPPVIAIDSTAMYVVGSCESPEPGDYEWRLEKRSLAYGNLVGVVTSNPSKWNDAAQAIAIDSTAMYVVGFDVNPGNHQWRIEKRSLADESLVTGFGEGGVITSNPSSDFDAAQAIAIDSTAMYVVGYSSGYGGDEQWRIEKRAK